MSQLPFYRNRIDAIDTQIITLLRDRFAIVRQVGEYKKAHGIPPLQPARWQEVLESKKRLAEECGLSPKFIETVWNDIHEHALELETP